MQLFTENPQTAVRQQKRRAVIAAIVTAICTLFAVGLIVVFNQLYPTGSSRAASVTWTGSTSSTWHTGSNWSSSVAPTSADDATIAPGSASTITLWSGQTASFNNLTIGGGGVTTTLVIIGNIGTGTNITIENKGVLEFKNAIPQTITGTITVKSGGVLTHSANTTAQAHIIDLTAQNIDVQSGGVIDIAGKGYSSTASASGRGPGAGIGTSGNYSSGAGHGGTGGNSTANGNQGGKGYCDITNINTIGSSGGSGNSTGGAGGGLVRLYAPGTITLNGSILANGLSGTSNPTTAGGAGGGVRMVADTITGTPTSFTVAGGTPSSGSSGGGGGCVQIAYTTSNSILDSQVTLSGGNGTAGNGGRPGGSGLLYVKQASATYGDLYLNNTFTTTQSTTTVYAQNMTFNSLSLTRSRFAVTSTQRITLAHPSQTPFAGGSQATPGTIFVQGTLDLGGASNLESTGLLMGGGTLVNPTSLIIGVNGHLSFSGVNTLAPLTSVSSSGQLYINRAAFPVSNMSLVMNPGATTTLAGFTTTTSPLVLSDLTINNNALLTHEANGSTQAHVINIAANNITINTGGSINVDGKGYSRNTAQCYGRGYGPGGGSGNSFVSQGAGGGGHGGAGGWGRNGNSGGVAYCVGSNIGTIGSAGGDGSACAFDAGAGGGLIVLSATSTVTINGTLSAKGMVAASGSTSNSGHGAGGGIKITAATVAGTPTLFSAAGGTGTIYPGGNGGGGCVRVGYGESSSVTSANISVLGGTGGQSGTGFGANGLVAVSSTLPEAPTVLYASDSDASAGNTNPTALTTTTPVFSAVCNTPNSDTCTTAEIEVADNSNFTDPVWESGQINIADITSSTRSQNITYAGGQLKYNTTYYWRIRMYNAYGAGAWSAGTNTFYAPRTIELYSFNLGGAVQSGKSIPVAWGSLGGSTTTAETVQIEYSIDNFVSTVATATSSVASAASSSTVHTYSWTVPSATALCGASSCSTVRIRISSNNDGNNYVVTSEQDFTVQNSPATGIKYGRTFGVADFYQASDAVSVSLGSGAATVAPTNVWTKRKAITVTNNTASTLTNFEVSIPVTYDSDMQADFDDIRFTSSDGTTFINYWLETKTDSASATFWVQVPSIAGSSAATIYMYYGNSSAATISSATSTFLFADDFSGTLDTSKWTVVGSPVNSSGLLTMSASNRGVWSTSYTLPGDVVIEAYVSKSASSHGNVGAANTSQRWLQEMNGASGFDYLMYGSSIYVEANSSETSFSSWSNTTYRRAKLIYRSGTSVRAYDNATTALLSSTVPLSSTGLHVQIYNYSGTMQADWVFVRTYAATDPSVSTGAEEAGSLSGGGGGSGTDYTIDFLSGHAFASANSFTASTTGAVRFQVSNDNGSSWKYCLGGTLTAVPDSGSTYANWASEITDDCLSGLAPGIMNIRSYLTTPTSTIASTLDYVAVALSDAANNAPVAPTSTSGVTATAVTYAWTSGGGDETYYGVDVSTDGENFTFVATTTETSYNFTGLATNTPYWFRVAAGDGIAATSTYTTSSRVYTLPNTPGAPALVSSVSSTTLSIYTSEATFGGNSTETTTFVVKDNGPLTPTYLQADGTWGSEIAYLTYAELGGGSGLTTTGLSANTPHTISFAAANPDNALTGYGSAVSAYTLAGIPYTPVLSAATTSTIGVTLFASGNPASTEYAIYNETGGYYVALDGTSNAFVPAWQTRTAWGGTATVRGLTPNTAYQFKVYAQNADGASSAASELSAAVSTEGVNNPSLSPVTSEIGQNSIRLDWTSGEGTETLYVLERSTNGTDFTEVSTVVVPTTNYTFSGLSLNTQYWFRVASADGVNATSSYATASPVFTSAATPDAPAAVTSAATSTLTITVSEDTINSNPQTEDTLYILKDSAGDARYLQTNGTWGDVAQQLTFAQLGSGTPTITTGLTANTLHTISIAAVNGDGVITDYSSTRSAYTRASVPGTPALAIDSDNRATLSWTGDATEYYVEATDLPSSWSSGVAATYGNLTCDTRYSFRVKGRNGDNVETDWTTPVFGVSGPCGGWSIWRVPTPTETQSDGSDATDNVENTEILPDGTPVFAIIVLEAKTELAVGDSSQVVVGSELHTVTVNNATNDAVNITLRSDPITATLKINVPQDFDTDGDGIKDVRALYTGIVNGKTQIEFTAIPTAPTTVTTTIPGIAVPTPVATSTVNSGALVPIMVRPSVAFTQTLKRGSKGNEVIELQKRLKQEGFFPQAVDFAPSFGAITEFAVKTYQKARGIPETGVLDALTRQTLNGVTNQIKVVPVSDSFFFTQTIRRGSSGLEVLQLQTLLLSLGFFPKSTVTTNFFGPITQVSLDKFQRANNTADERDQRGPYTGPKTREKLNTQ